ncbi:MAG: HPP family protein [Persicimonas sp.]
MKARDVMTEYVLSGSVEAPIGAAKGAMEDHEIRHLPIVDGGRVIGILSLRELTSAASIASHFGIERDAYEEYLHTPVGEFMKTRFSAEGDVITVHPEAPLASVIDLLIDERLSAVPVVDDGDNLIGIVSYIDVLEAFRSEM